MEIIKLNSQKPQAFHFTGLVDCGRNGFQAAFARQNGVRPGGIVDQSSEVQIFTVPYNRLRGKTALSSLKRPLRRAALAAFDQRTLPTMYMEGRTLCAGRTKLGTSRVDGIFFAEVPLKFASGALAPTRNIASLMASAPADAPDVAA